MANHKSSEKRNRQTIKKSLVNRTRESAVKTAVKKVRDAIAKNDKKAALELFPMAQSLLNKLARHKIIKSQTAGRKTSRLKSQINKLA